MILHTDRMVLVVVAELTFRLIGRCCVIARKEYKNDDDYISVGGYE